jgi:hypothetical protein
MPKDTAPTAEYPHPANYGFPNFMAFQRTPSIRITAITHTNIINPGNSIPPSHLDIEPFRRQQNTNTRQALPFTAPNPARLL